LPIPQRHVVDGFDGYFISGLSKTLAEAKEHQGKKYFFHIVQKYRIR